MQKYYIRHSTSYENLLSIVKSGKLLANKYVEESKWRLSGEHESKYIYTNIVFDDKNIGGAGHGAII